MLGMAYKQTDSDTNMYMYTHTHLEHALAASHAGEKKILEDIWKTERV